MKTISQLKHESAQLGISLFDRIEDKLYQLYLLPEFAKGTANCLNRAFQAIAEEWDADAEELKDFDLYGWE